MKNSLKALPIILLLIIAGATLYYSVSNILYYNKNGQLAGVQSAYNNKKVCCRCIYNKNTDYIILSGGDAHLVDYLPRNGIPDEFEIFKSECLGNDDIRKQISQQYMKDYNITNPSDPKLIELIGNITVMPGWLNEKEQANCTTREYKEIDDIDKLKGAMCPTNTIGKNLIVGHSGSSNSEQVFNVCQEILDCDDSGIINQGIIVSGCKTFSNLKESRDFADKLKAKADLIKKKYPNKFSSIKISIKANQLLESQENPSSGKFNYISSTLTEFVITDKCSVKTNLPTCSEIDKPGKLYFVTGQIIQCTNPKGNPGYRKFCYVSKEEFFSNPGIANGNIAVLGRIRPQVAKGPNDKCQDICHNVNITSKSKSIFAVQYDPENSFGDFYAAMKINKQCWSTDDKKESGYFTYNCDNQNKLTSISTDCAHSCELDSDGVPYCK